ncbi:hypothetical protein M5362_27145 [Streptomyces sp. Je 1-79]|uniref:hypothetical protein n=1 Tax=Streptomyces sp. Je 1-79 TaxID=2943847 RepID=UPI0021A7198D|nr:hypothetical protein [Streptomyces sp. Je 1-79]MCT4356802.1 hypothetical protein [Streptomyces sp. Je 1-79]
MTGTETLAADWVSSLFKLLVNLLPEWAQDTVVALLLTFLAVEGGRRLWRAVRARRSAT